LSFPFLKYTKKITRPNRMKRNKTRKLHRGSSGMYQLQQVGGSDCRIGVGFPKFGGGGDKRKIKPINIVNELLNVAGSIRGGDCGCSKAPMMELPSGISLGPLTSGLKGGACPCQEAPKIPTALGGYRATKRNIKYLKKWKRGESIGFTMRSSLKAKGLIPRANGKKRVSAKYLK
jgi:hypothetical protein